MVTVDHVQMLSYYRHGFIRNLKEQGTEMDLVACLWSLLDQSFHQLGVVTREIKRARRHLQGSMKEEQYLDQCQSPTKPLEFVRTACLIKHSIELGVSECGKDDQDSLVGKKEIAEAQKP
ncbi:predicted protein [Lichtheimia corymbifera JMRC:FSU:9682]|uniref:Uncharacterized protein n=1 Tax=Lichtheimia corymbifera JMRC:FSU:9682 TaxID=1263082 RepID=A0A068RUL3_9FUNG|nr:predicted protein [Lichtheimia corymbifera JMRC:FSU:9682]